MHMDIHNTIHQWFEDQAIKFPDRFALTFDNQSITYRQLNEKANQVAHAIRHQYQKVTSQELASDTLVLLCLPRSLNQVIGILGVLKAGGAYVPIDPKDPSSRIQYFLEDTESSLIVTEGHLVPKLKEVADRDIGWLLLDDPAIQSSFNKSNLHTHTQSMDLAYVIYTSGTTGTPKGVMQTHENVLRLFHVTAQYFHFNASDAWLLYHSYTFDFSVWEIWGALFYGGRLVVPTDVERQDPHLLYQLCINHHITILNFTPAVFFTFVQYLIGQHISTLPMRFIILGGEKLQTSQLKSWWHIFHPNGPHLVNMYGITETTVHVTFKRLTPEIGHTCVIGKALEDLIAYVWDKHGSSVKEGEIGELYVGGNGLARGYLNQPELTTERFIAHPSVPNTRLYKTGDLVRLLAEGELEYIGRNDSQVKIRGFRVELGEIERTLLMHPMILQCVVLLWTESVPELIAFYLSQSMIDEQLLSRFLKERLPNHMIPRRFIHQAHFPMTNHGKIDRRLLLELFLKEAPKDSRLVEFCKTTLTY